MNDLLFKNDNKKSLNKIVRGLLKNRKNLMAICAIMLSTLLFTSLFTIAISLHTSMSDSNMRQIGTYAHAGIKHITAEEYDSIKSDDRIKESGYSVIIGMASGKCFDKTPAEVRYASDDYAKWTYNYPEIGKLPKKENELATSRIVLEAMGVPAELGTQITLSVETDSDIKEETFTLCGIWEGSPVSYRQTILLSEPYMQKNAPMVHGISSKAIEESSGYIDILFMLPSTWDMEKYVNEMAAEYGMDDRPSINEYYITADISADEMIPIIAGILVIFIAGYLLIYNVFYISIAQDIRFYGMLKTLGTTSKQIRKIVYRRALCLSLIGIPAGLILGWPIGKVLLPHIFSILSEDMKAIKSANPKIFIIAAVFSLLTVCISCRKPAGIAAKVSPIEALKYNETVVGKKKKRRSKHISSVMMAFQNISRNKRKVAVVTLSAALSVMLLNSVYTYIRSFDFDKFVSTFSLTDFSVSDTSIINSSSPDPSANVSGAFVEEAESLDGLEHIGCIYTNLLKYPLDEIYLDRMGELAKTSEAIARDYGNYMVRKESGVSLYGFDEWPAEYLEVVEGEIDDELWKTGKGIYVTNMRMVGDGSISLYEPGDTLTFDRIDGTKASYKVLAVVKIPDAFRTPMSIDMGTEFVLPTSEYKSIIGYDVLPMRTVFNVDDEHLVATENWLKNYTTNIDTDLDYFSKEVLRNTFKGLINMYRIVGGVLCAVLATIAILNFTNSIVTSVMSRYKEIAMMQSVGMTGNQVKQMLISEGLGYSIIGLLCSLAISIFASFTIVRMLGEDLTYFTWRFTLVPFMLCIIPFVVIAIVIPICCYKIMEKKSVIERLGVADNT